MNFKYFTSKLPPTVLKRGYVLFYKYLTPSSKVKAWEFERTMDQLIRALEQGLHLG